MASKLIIVESPAKANTIKKFLGSSWKVVASQGHIRDLPKSKLGVNVEKDFEPEYINIRGKAELIRMLKKEAKSVDSVYLATDPDREGEAIAWHLAHILDIDEKSKCRVTFNEITKEAITNAVKEPRSVDMDLTNAQQARRVLDRIVGYKMSPVLWKKVRKGLSAGRVQSVAVKLIADREEEIEKFIPEEYWNLYANLKAKKEFEARLYAKEGNKIEIHSEEEMNKILKDLENAKYIIEDIKKGEKRVNPAPPFITSTLQQEASRKLGYTLKKTMAVAQMLYEAGLITYMRTDSTRISEEARANAKKQIVETYGETFYENRYYKSKKDSQDAHEAIRPSYIDRTPEELKSSLTPEQHKVYSLIYNRFLASQMSQAVYDTMSVEILANNYNFRATGSKLKFKGFMTLYVFEDEEKENSLPELEVKSEVKCENLNPVQSFTEPPPRYTEASLVKTLEEKGIGRPSTYAPTITTILERRYIEKDKKQLFPTDLGKIVNKLLVENFENVVNIEFTAQMEEKLDNVEEGEVKWKEIIKEFYGPFIEVVEKVDKELEHVKLEEEISDVPCDKCGKMMVIKYGRFGKFLACPGFPDCKNAKPIVVPIEEPCPKCGAQVVIKKSKRKRNFYVCENNPGTCDYISWNKPGEEEKKEDKEEKPKKTRKKKK